MTELIKQRLVGMLIVVIAGVVFIPDLLDGQKQTSKSDFKKIPETPEFNTQPKLTEFPLETVKENIAKVPTSNEVAVDSMAEDDNEPNPNEGGFKPQESNLASSDDVLASTQASEINNQPQPVETSNKESHQETVQSSAVEQNKPSQKVAAKAPTTTNEPNPSRYKKPLYILQLGSFKHKENVTTLRDKLKQAGYETYTKPVKTKSGVLSKVYIGPESDKDKLEKAQIKLKELTGLAGKITRFEPTN